MLLEVVERNGSTNRQWGQPFEDWGRYLGEIAADGDTKTLEGIEDALNKVSRKKVVTITKDTNGQVIEVKIDQSTFKVRSYKSDKD